MQHNNEAFRICAEQSLNAVLNKPGFDVMGIDIKKTKRKLFSSEANTIKPSLILRLFNIS